MTDAHTTDSTFHTNAALNQMPPPIDATDSLAGLPLMTALRKLGLTDQALLGAEFRKPHAARAAAEYYFPKLLTSGKTMHGDRPLLLRDIQVAITMRRADARYKAKHNGAQRKTHQGMLRQLAKARQVKALKAATRRTTASAAKLLGLPAKTPPPSAPTLRSLHALATRLVEQIETLQDTMKGLA